MSVWQSVDSFCPDSLVTLNICYFWWQKNKPWMASVFKYAKDEDKEPLDKELLKPWHRAFSHEPSRVPRRGCCEYCSLKIDPNSRSCPLPSGELVIYVNHSQPGNNLPASVSIQPSLFLSHTHTHTHCTVYDDLCPVQSAKWRLLSLTPPGRLAFAVKQQCRPLTWQMVLDDKKNLGLYIQSLKS